MRVKGIMTMVIRTAKIVIVGFLVIGMVYSMTNGMVKDYLEDTMGAVVNKLPENMCAEVNEYGFYYDVPYTNSIDFEEDTKCEIIFSEDIIKIKQYKISTGEVLNEEELYVNQDFTYVGNTCVFNDTTAYFVSKGETLYMEEGVCFFVNEYEKKQQNITTLGNIKKCKGDGMLSYGGSVLPNIENVLELEKYPYVHVIDKYSSEEFNLDKAYYLLMTDNKIIRVNRVGDVTYPVGTKYMLVKLENNTWIKSEEKTMNEENKIIIKNMFSLWCNYTVTWKDVTHSFGNPTPLDGAELIIFDGDKTGLNTVQDLIYKVSDTPIDFKTLYRCYGGGMDVKLNDEKTDISSCTFEGVVIVYDELVLKAEENIFLDADAKLDKGIYFWDLLNVSYYFAYYS